MNQWLIAFLCTMITVTEISRELWLLFFSSFIILSIFYVIFIVSNLIT